TRGHRMTTVEPRIGSLNVVDLTGNLGGGTRFVRALLPALKRARPSLRIVLSGSAASLARQATAELAAVGIAIRSLPLFPGVNWYSQPFRNRARYRWRRLRGAVPDRGEFVAMQFARSIGDADLL